ncbi:terminase small subunit [Globicatella sanguinis]
MAKLTLKQKKFADEYIISGNAYQSALKAGYSDNYAKGNVIKLLENVRVRAYIDERLKEVESKKIAKADEVLQTFTKILRQELMEEKTEVNPITGEFITIDRPPSINEVIKAGVEIMKRYPLDNDNSGEIVINYRGIPNESD